MAFLILNFKKTASKQSIIYSQMSQLKTLGHFFLRLFQDEPSQKQYFADLFATLARTRNI